MLANMIKLALVCCCLAATSACTRAYVASVSKDTLESARLSASFQVRRNADWVVHANTPIFLGRPVSLSTQSYRRNLLALYQSLNMSLQQGFPTFASDSESLPLDEAFILAQSRGSELLLWPRLVKVEDRLNTRQEIIEGKGIHPSREYGTDRAVFQVLIYEVRTHALLDVATVFSRSRMLADRKSIPQDLYQKASLHYLLAITGKEAG